MRRMPLLGGVLVPMLTPIMEDDTLDLEGVQNLGAHLLASDSVNGLFAIGATAEFLHLSIHERMALMEKFATVPKGEKIITVNIGGLPYDQMIELARFSERLKLDAVAMSVPVEIEPTTASVVSYFKRIAGLGIPFLVYWTPMAKNHAPTPEIVAELMKFENFVGLKDSSRDMVAFTTIAAAYGDEISVLQGVEMLHLASLAVGSAGIVGGGLNLYPGLPAQTTRCFMAGDFDQAKALQLRTNESWDTLKQVGTFRSFCKQYWKNEGVIKGVHCRAENGETCTEQQLAELQRLADL